MDKKHPNFIKTLLLPCLTFSVATGIFSALLISLFSILAENVIHLSGQIYDAVRADPKWLACLLIGSAAIGLIASFLLSFSHSCRGGGIPTSIAAIRGITRLKWYKSISILPVSALLTFLCGLPLGTEGPCVQMGTAIGDGTVSLLGGKKNIGWKRYMMTGGAAAGFSIATGAPITAILFSMEELHKRFSPLLFSVASISVIVGQITARFIAELSGRSIALFHIDMTPALSLNLIFIPLFVGLACGVGSVIFTKFYNKVDKLIRVKLGRLSVKLKFPIIFVCISLIGFFFAKILSTGHSLVDHLLHTHLLESPSIWYLPIIIFLVRAILMMVSNTAGITGGIFLPTLSFGAILGALCAEGFIAIGLIDVKHYILLVTLGMVAFLGASSRIPITASVFAIELLGGINNILPVIVAVTSAFLIIELSGRDDFTDTVVKTQEEAIHAGKKAHVIEVPLTVYKNSFVIGKELRDILWPASCVMLSIDRKSNHDGRLGITEGDVLTVYYRTYDPIATAEEFEVLVGDQSADIDRIMRPE